MTGDSLKPDLFDAALYSATGAGLPPFSPEGVIRPEYLAPAPEPLGGCPGTPGRTPCGFSPA